jgi:hypothetical protein
MDIVINLFHETKGLGEARIHFADREKPDPIFSLHINF